MKIGYMSSRSKVKIKIEISRMKLQIVTIKSRMQKMIVFE